MYFELRFVDYPSIVHCEGGGTAGVEMGTDPNPNRCRSLHSASTSAVSPPPQYITW